VEKYRNPRATEGESIFILHSFYLRSDRNSFVIYTIPMEQSVWNGKRTCTNNRHPWKGL